MMAQQGQSNFGSSSLAGTTAGSAGCGAWPAGASPGCGAWPGSGGRRPGS